MESIWPAGICFKCLVFFNLFTSSPNGGALYNELKNKPKKASVARCWQPPARIDASSYLSMFGKRQRQGGDAFHSDTSFLVS